MQKCNSYAACKNLTIFLPLYDKRAVWRFSQKLLFISVLYGYFTEFSAAVVFIRCNNRFDIGWIAAASRKYAVFSVALDLHQRVSDAFDKAYSNK